MAAAPKHGSRPGHTALTGLLVTRWGGAGDRCCGCYWLRDNSGGSPHWPGHFTSSSGNIKMGTNRLQLSTALSAKAATVAASVLCCDFSPLWSLRTSSSGFRLQISFICHKPNNLLMVESPVSLLGWWQWRMKNVWFIASVNSVKWAIPRIYGMLYCVATRNIPRRAVARVTGGDGEEILAAAWTQARTTIRWTATLTLQWTLRGFSRRRPPIEPSPSTSTFNLRHY